MNEFSLKILWWLYRGQVGWQANLLGVATTSEMDLIDSLEDRYF